MQEFIGKTFGKWTILSYEGKSIHRQHQFKVKCECGKESISEKTALQKGKSTRCRSCARKLNTQNEKNPAFRHGYSKEDHPNFHVYVTWCSMKSRCYNKKNHSYKIYGGRGIKVCKEWLENFENFLNDMGFSDKKSSLDRIDVNGDYCKENCRWADKETQANNTRPNVYYVFKGEKLSETQWARKLGLSRNKFMWWVRKNGFEWVLEHLESLKLTKTRMSDDEYLKLGLDLPEKRYRK